MEETEELAQTVKHALVPYAVVRFALVYGSAAAGASRADSDLDVAVYLDSDGHLEVEALREDAAETDIQLSVERATNRNVDLLVLNRSPATVCAAAVTLGCPVLVRDGSLFGRYCLAVTDVAAMFRQTEREYREIRARSASLSGIDRDRLLRILDFVDEEMSDRSRLASITHDTYRKDRDIRRSLDRWVETLITAAIDIGKVVLASLHRPVPQTYGQILADLEALPDFSRLAGRLAPLAGLRNLMAHEYLDLRWTRVRDFASTGSTAVMDLAAAARAWLDSQPEQGSPGA